VHILAGVLTTYFVLSGDTAAISGRVDGTDPNLITGTYPDALAAILGQHGFNLG
jgi:hypothetical protein